MLGLPPGAKVETRDGKSQQNHPQNHRTNYNRSVYSAPATHPIFRARPFRRGEMSMNASDTILTYGVSDACAAMGFGKTKLYALIAEGRIEARQCGGRTLIPAESLRAFVANLPLAPIRSKASA